jgi:hypothetical protein
VGSKIVCEQHASVFTLFKLVQNVNVCVSLQFFQLVLKVCKLKFEEFLLGLKLHLYVNRVTVRQNSSHLNNALNCIDQEI